MKSFFKSFTILSLLCVLAVPATLRAQDDSEDDQGASFQTFYDQLGSQGTWVQTDDYGYVFQPNVSDPDWAPYTDGHWVYTDDGWTWVSDEPWGWATYHYGRWANIDGIGWIWIPGYRWAPAWVSWRYGGGYCGWAPLPPETFIGAEYAKPGVSIGFGFHFGGDVDRHFGIGPRCYNFVRVDDLGERNYRGHFLDHTRNFTVINQTTNVTNININGNVVNQNDRVNHFRGVAVGGPPINEVNAHTRRAIDRVQLASINQPGRSNLEGNSLGVYAPRINPESVHQAKPGYVSQSLHHAELNRGTSVTKPLDINPHLRSNAPSPELVQSAEEARHHAPDHAKIALENSTPVTTGTQPITSLQPVESRHHRENGGQGFNGANANPGVQPNAPQTTLNSPVTGQTENPSAPINRQDHAPQIIQNQPQINNSVTPSERRHDRAQTENPSQPQVQNPGAIHNNVAPVINPAQSQGQNPEAQLQHPHDRAQTENPSQPQVQNPGAIHNNVAPVINPAQPQGQNPESEQHRHHDHVQNENPYREPVQNPNSEVIRHNLPPAETRSRPPIQEVPHHIEAPAQTVRPTAPVIHQSPAPAPAPANHPAPSNGGGQGGQHPSGGGNHKPGDDKNQGH